MIVIYIICEQIHIYWRIFKLHGLIGYTLHYCLSRCCKPEVLKVSSGLGTLQVSKTFLGFYKVKTILLLRCCLYFLTLIFSLTYNGVFQRLRDGG